MQRLFLMLLAIAVSTQAAGAEGSAPGWPASKDTGSGWPAAEKGAPGWPSSAAGKGSSRPASEAHSQRRLSKHRGRRSGKMTGWPVPDKELLARTPTPPSGNLHIYSHSYNTETKVNIYNPDGSFNVQALAEISHIFKCRRSGLEHDIDTRLITVLSHIYDHFGGKRIELLSGYRFQRRTTSNHFHGSAADIRIAGIDPRTIRAYAESLDAGGMGVGWYPNVGFVHVDVRPLPSYRWIDYSHSNPDARDRQPPRGFKRKDPES
jgi:uncharacterized protein YcbK (DUF882 family)